MNTPPSLIVPVRPPAGASLPGLIAASARLNVLGDVSSTLAAIGLRPQRPGTISLRIAGLEEMLAARLGCDAGAIAACATPYVGSAEEGVVRWGGGALRRHNLDTVRRRVSPKALETDPHHRAGWMNLLLDYCPETLELLIDACPRCSRPLGWRAAWGIGHCDDRECGPLSPSDERLPGDVAERYRLFAALTSPVPQEREAALATLDPALAVLPPMALPEFAFALGAALNAATFSGPSSFRKLASAEKALCAAEGAGLLRRWPENLRDAVRNKVASEHGRTAAARRALQDALQLASVVDGRRSPVARLMRRALPEAFVEPGRAFAGIHRPMMLGSAAAVRLGTKHAQLAAAARAGVFTEEAAWENSRRRVQYSVAEIEAAEAAKEGSTSIGEVVRRLGAPRYACEHMVRSGDVEREQHSYVLLLPGQPRALRSSLDLFEAAILDACSASPPPDGAVSLTTALRMVGGRLKPWSHVLREVAAGRLPSWNAGRGPTLVSRLRVRQADLRCCLASHPAAENDGHPLVPSRLSQFDTMEVLNLRQLDGPCLAAAGLLTFVREGRALWVPTATVLSLATEFIATAEAAAKLGMTPPAAFTHLVRALGARSPAGWNRRGFEAAFGA